MKKTNKMDELIEDIQTIKQNWIKKSFDDNTYVSESLLLARQFFEAVDEWIKEYMEYEESEKQEWEKLRSVLFK